MSSTASPQKVGFLVPLNDDLEVEEESSIPRISLCEGPNVVGRNCIPITDKRLSRKHLTVHGAANGSVEVLVEGANPIVLRKNNERRKLLSGQKLKIDTGDILELIPGHYFFKYVTVARETNEISTPTRQKRHLDEANASCSKDHAFGRKRTRDMSEEEDLLKQSEQGNNGKKTGSYLEGIRQFRISNDKIPLTFRLLRVQGLPSWANTNAVSITDVIQGNVLIAILSNYMVDIDWLLSACPMLKKVLQVLVIHGEGDGTAEYMKRKKPASWILHKPPLPISYGTHHSKAMLLVYPQGVRVIVHTANLIHVDWNNKSQGLWMQDFPWKDQKNPSKGCSFESDLVDYLSTLKWPEFSADLQALGRFSISPLFFKKFDYSSSAVRLIASVPGYHTGANLKKWGHMKMRSVLQEFTFDKQFQRSPLVYQFSSLGSLDEKWMEEFAYSLCAGVSDDKKPLGMGEPLIIWPTVEDVRCSLEGYAAGNAIPSPLKNVEKVFLKKYWAKWKASQTGRCRAMPHIKTFARYNDQNLAWFLLTSANLSKAAWGALQKNNSQLMMRSYELGVLFLPSPIKPGCEFSCTSRTTPDVSGSEVKKTKLVTLAGEGNSAESTLAIQLPVPYELPPIPYSAEDVPWSWDRRYTKKDVYGQVWPRQVQLYTCQDS